MTPVDQTILGYPNGNCFAACVATVLDLPLDAVPNFCQLLPGETDEDNRHHERFADWLIQRGYGTICFRGDLREWCGRFMPGLPWLAGGKSPRGDWLHSVVFVGSELAHDPHPSRAGIVGPATDTTLIVPLAIGGAR